MDINTLRIAVTLVSFVLFVGIVAWAWSRRRESDFEAAAQLPFQDEAPSSNPRRD
ncbi:MAG: cbb3-type cytochrome c oxidase subunit 3 [Proteobacteria bacterium]|nr:cbb3-type cytochrome c oxidase subunit 3 [Pseudomonadota bacterium]